MKTISWRLIVTLIVLLTATVFILPTIQMAVKKIDAPTLWPKKKINLGLDLQGGVLLVLEVDTNAAVKTTVERTRQELRYFAKKNHIRPQDIRLADGTTILLTLRPEEDPVRANDLIANEFNDYSVSKDINDGVVTIKMVLC